MTGWIQPWFVYYLWQCGANPGMRDPHDSVDRILWQHGNTVVCVPKDNLSTTGNSNVNIVFQDLLALFRKVDRDDSKLTKPLLQAS